MNKRKVTNYTEEFKKSSAQLAVESKQSVTKTAQELGVNATTLHGWVNRYFPKTTVAKTKHSAPVDDVQAELHRLRKELARVKIERDILKKAAAYFASEAQ